jgi:hypothetical protein
MPFERSRWVRAGLIRVIAPVLLAVSAFAQEKKPEWHDVPFLPTSAPWLQWLFGVVLVLLCLAMAFKNPHRSHLD